MKLRREHITYCITFGCLPPSYPREGIFRFVCVSTPKYNHDFVCGVRKRKSRSFIFLVKTSSNRNEIYRIIQLNLLNVYSISRFSKCVASLVVLWVCHFQLDLSWIHSVSRYFQLKAFFLSQFVASDTIVLTCHNFYLVSSEWESEKNHRNSDGNAQKYHDGSQQMIYLFLYSCDIK